MESRFCLFFLSSSPQRDTNTGSTGVSVLSTATFDMRCNVSSPDTSRPKIVCLPDKCGHGSKVMKNLSLVLAFVVRS